MLLAHPLHSSSARNLSRFDGKYGLQPPGAGRGRQSKSSTGPKVFAKTADSERGAPGRTRITGTSMLTGISSSTDVSYATQLAQTSALKRSFYNLGTAIQNGDLSSANSILTGADSCQTQRNSKSLRLRRKRHI